METETRHVEVRGRRILELHGGEGRPLVYLHSAMGETLWLPHLTALASRRQLHAPAHPGWSGSEGAEDIRDVEDLVYHYLAYFDRMGWESVDLVGLSLGGWIAAEIAARYPERVSKLVLVSSVGIWIRERPIADIFALDMRFPDRLRKMFFHDVDCFAATMMMPPPGAPVPDELLIHLMTALSATAKIGWNPLLHDPKLERLLSRVTAPTLCLWGAEDRVVPLEYGKKFAALIPGARLEVVPECGHLLPMEKEAAFTAAVMAFLDG